MIREAISHWLQSTWRPTGFQTAGEVKAVIGTDVGLARRENQDRAFVARINHGYRWREAFTVAILCDGIGGMVAGGQCAELAALEIITTLVMSSQEDLKELLRYSLEQANTSVHDQFGGKGGTTVVALLISDSLLMAASAGDSRIYCHDGKSFEQVSVDDTIAGELARMSGQDVRREALDATSRNLAQYVGMGEGFEPRSYSFEPSRRPISFLLTTDGAHFVGNRILARMYEHAQNGEFVRRILALSKWFGGYDNATVIKLDADGMTSKPRLQCEWKSLEIWSSDGKAEFFLDAEGSNGLAVAMRQLAEVTAKHRRGRTLIKESNPIQSVPEHEFVDPIGKGVRPADSSVKQPKQISPRKERKHRERSASVQQKLEIEVSQMPLDEGRVEIPTLEKQAVSEEK